jgi:uncharacterized Fe-S cluster protein YjdI
MDILYYSNYCKHSQKVVQTLVKGNLQDKLSFVCIDTRRRDPKTGQTYISMENGSKVVMPPNVHSVPALLLINQNYRIILGDEIIQHYHPEILKSQSKAVQGNGEPMAYQLNKSSGGTNIVSEQFTSYDMSPDDLSAKSNSTNRPMYDYVTVNGGNTSIATPDDTYKPNKVGGDVTVDNLQQKRMDEINQILPNKQPMIM